ncbi:MAG: cobalamin biosynthesis protein CbiX [Flavobacteriales bacterium]|nr:MAG: cobalamin biosynthesis protein CbiX [Flavobacteriales bacterium]
MKRIISFFTMIVLALGMMSCNQDKKGVSGEQKIGVLLVNHGSHSENWRNQLLDLEKKVRPILEENKDIKGIKTAFMEYNEPSIATRLKEFDDAGFTDVVLVPIFLTVSPHSFDDIPTIVGLKKDPKSLESLKLENIKTYKPKNVKVHMTPLLDFTDILEKNVLARVKALSKDPKNEGVSLIGYGDEDYEKEWIELFGKVGDYLKTNIGIDKVNHAWCGHIAHYKTEPTTEAIEKILEEKKKAIVIPVLVAVDEDFQMKIIGGGVAKVKDTKEKVVYKPDAILPDVNVEQWVIDITNKEVGKLTK